MLIGDGITGGDSGEIEGTVLFVNVVAILLLSLLLTSSPSPSSSSSSSFGMMIFLKSNLEVEEEEEEEGATVSSVIGLFVSNRPVLGGGSP